MGGLGIFSLMVALLAFIYSFFMFLFSIGNKNKETRKIALYSLLTGAITLLISFTLCSVSGFKL